MAKKNHSAKRPTANGHKTEPHPVEVLTFTNQDLLATIATDGTRHVVQIIDNLVEFTTLTKAIAYLEARGYSIDPGEFKSI